MANIVALVLAKLGFLCTISEQSRWPAFPQCQNHFSVSIVAQAILAHVVVADSDCVRLDESLSINMWRIVLIGLATMAGASGTANESA